MFASRPIFPLSELPILLSPHPHPTMERSIPSFVPTFGNLGRRASGGLLFRSQPAFSAPVCTAASAPVMGFELGARVRVSRSVIMFHYPGKKNTPVDVEGYEGIVKKDISVKDGVEMSAIAPYMIDFRETGHPKFRAHFEEGELEAVDEPEVIEASDSAES